MNNLTRCKDKFNVANGKRASQGSLCKEVSPQSELLVKSYDRFNIYGQNCTERSLTCGMQWFNDTGLASLNQGRWILDGRMRLHIGSRLKWI